jgi:hypothetical protein
MWPYLETIISLGKESKFKIWYIATHGGSRLLSQHLKYWDRRIISLRLHGETLLKKQTKNWNMAYAEYIYCFHINKVEKTVSQTPKLLYSFNFFFFLQDWVWTQGSTFAKQAFYCLSHTSSPFCSGYFGDGVFQTICPGWPWTVILLTSASQIAGITGVSYGCLASFNFLCIKLVKVNNQQFIFMKLFFEHF